MNIFISKIIDRIIYILRVFQFLLIIYLILGVFYWILVLGNLVLAVYLEPLYQLPIAIVNSIAESINWNIGEKFSMLCPDIFFAIVLIFVAVIISNFIFVILGWMEKKFVEKAYEKGERDYD